MNELLRDARRRAGQANPPRPRYIYLVRQPHIHGGDYWTWHGAGRWTAEEVTEIHKRAAEAARRLERLVDRE